jgi:WD40 repeat protein
MGKPDKFDPLKGELLKILHGHLNEAFGLAFSPDGRRLIRSFDEARLNSARA